MKKFLFIMLFGFLVFGFFARMAQAGEIDILLQKLVDKGILTPGEAQEIGTETKEQVKKEISQVKYDMLPEWVQKMKLKGDFRTRYQLKADKGLGNDNAARIRARLGVETKINEQMKAGLGIATGTTSDPRSTNVTLGDSGTSNATPTASFKNIILDYAYGQYSPVSWMTLTAGKFKNPIWQPNNMLWDGDLNPEGANVQIDYRLNPYAGLFLNGEAFILNYKKVSSTVENSNAMMWVVQPGVKYNLHDWLDVKAGVAAYFTTNVKDMPKFNLQSTNSLRSNNTYKYTYNSFNPSVEISMKEPFKGIPILGQYVPYFGMFGDFVYNPNPLDGNGGYDYGLKFGSEKVGDWGQWQARADYAKLGRDAFLDIFPDSDRYSGKTNMQSWEGNLEYGLGKNTTLNFNYHWAQSLTASGDSYLPQQLFLLDWNLKF
ncbi:MAG: putative porin [Candidatus Omnitrophica bacterium]|nr:putative porin [Candidatus Omnitrophota bacterium]